MTGPIIMCEDFFYHMSRRHDIPIFHYYFCFNNVAYFLLGLAEMFCLDETNKISLTYTRLFC